MALQFGHNILALQCDTTKEKFSQGSVPKAKSKAVMLLLFDTVLLNVAVRMTMEANLVSAGNLVTAKKRASRDTRSCCPCLPEEYIKKLFSSTLTHF